MKNIITLQLWEFVPSWATWYFGATMLKYSLGEENIQNDSGKKVIIFGGYVDDHSEEKCSCEHVFTSEWLPR
jgi:hypothetical protein